MERESKIKSFLNWVEEIREELEIQFYGIIGAIFFFIVFYFIFKPDWMKNVFDSFLNNNNS
tara:strand:- start:129 stop:311 length:183 start_codon:yes stop_codon:yes gene_type:complete